MAVPVSYYFIISYKNKSIKKVISVPFRVILVINRLFRLIRVILVIRITVICELKRALYGIKCVLRIF